MTEHIFQRHQALQVHTQLRIPPAKSLAQDSAAKTIVTTPESLALAFSSHMLIHQAQQPPRLRRQLIQAAPQHLMRYCVGELNVAKLNFNVFDDLLALAWPPMHFDLTLVLMHEGNRVDEGQVLFMITTQARRLVREA